MARGREIPVSEVVLPPYTYSVCMLEWKCPVSRAKGVFLLPLVCVHLPPPLMTLPPVHFMQAHPDVYSCVVEGCPLETKSDCQQ